MRVADARSMEQSGRTEMVAVNSIQGATLKARLTMPSQGQTPLNRITPGGSGTIFWVKATCGVSEEEAPWMKSLKLITSAAGTRAPFADRNR